MNDLLAGGIVLMVAARHSECPVQSRFGLLG